MVNLVKTVKEDGKIVKIEVKMLKDGSCLLFREKTFVRKYKELEKCLSENEFYEFVKERFADDEYRD